MQWRPLGRWGFLKSGRGVSGTRGTAGDRGRPSMGPAHLERKVLWCPWDAYEYKMAPSLYLFICLTHTEYAVSVLSMRSVPTATQFLSLLY